MRNHVTVFCEWKSIYEHRWGVTKQNMELDLFHEVNICCMARSLRSLRQVATLRHGHMARRFAAFRALGVYVNIAD